MAEKLRGAFPVPAFHLVYVYMYRTEVVFGFQETRDGRVDSWRNFQAKGKSKEKKNRSFLKPPKVKMEQRE